jgi:hypothetical protein
MITRKKAQAYFDMRSILSENPTVTTVLYGIRLRALRIHFFGTRTKNRGRPIKSHGLGKFKTWEGMVMTLSGIGISCATHWMRLADAFERLAEREGISLREVFEKLPWDWSSEEAALVNDTVHKLCDGKTQIQLLKEGAPSGNYRSINQKSHHSTPQTS